MIVNSCSRPVAVVALLVCLAVPSVAAPVQEEDDIDAFMQKVLERRVTNWEDLYRYTVRDTEAFDLTGPGGVSLESYHAESIWYVRDSYMVRSPYEVNGARVGDKEREKAEHQWLERAQREEKKREQDKQRKRQKAAESGDPDPTLEREYFLGFPFEPGNYYVAGEEEFEGMQLLRVEYYPQTLFEDDGDTDEEDLELARRFDKTSLVTMWILPDEHQIVRIRYDNIGLDFLPMRWLMQVDDVEAELIMSKPLEGQDVWLPREITAGGKVVVATGGYAFRYSLSYHDYKETEVGAKVHFRLPRGLERQQ